MTDKSSVNSNAKSRCREMDIDNLFLLYIVLYFWQHYVAQSIKLQRSHRHQR